MTILDTQG